MGLITVAHRPTLQSPVERLERRACVSRQRHPTKLVAVQLGDVDVDEPNVWVLKRGPRAGREVAVAGADADDDVGLRGDSVGCRRAGGSDGAEGAWMIERQRPLAGLGLRDGDSAAPDEPAQHLRRLGVDDAAARDEERLLGAPDQARRAVESRSVGQRPRDVPDTHLEKTVRIVVRLGLHVLGQGQRDGAGVRLAGQDPHRGNCRGDELLRPLDPVEVPRHRDEGIVDADIAARGTFQLLKNGIGTVGGEHVSRQKQHREAIDRGRGRAGHHVGGTGPDRSRARKGGQPVSHLGETRRRVNHGLLVARLVIGEQVGVLSQSLTDPGQVAVAEDAEATRDEPVLDTVPLHVLGAQKAHERLRHRHADGFHATTSVREASRRAPGRRGRHTLR